MPSRDELRQQAAVVRACEDLAIIRTTLQRAQMIAEYHSLTRLAINFQTLPHVRERMSRLEKALWPAPSKD